MKFTGGALTVKDYLRWVRALPPQYTSQLREANDTMLIKFARILTQNVLLLREADAEQDRDHATRVGVAQAPLRGPARHAPGRDGAAGAAT